ncbi:DNA polymerase III subunit beta [Saccharicrinis fermentans]|uniref:Beta sliding clamp n=1 Tax=Saccharicrinis fermentans DSM 9555 = JCM 21142 TaxID=869213 RepID=W7YHF4_9BACT|nr:DNA polymerase III subunit beta [Saccharicrinis fermentans]GAF03876.1 DNA polymerase III subunit beta [Saccharicrinis fermentans DSM 9555 = JCM 21142]
MKFVVSSSELLYHLQAVSRVVSSKSTIPILENILFELSEGKLTITASDLESTMVTSMSLENVEGEGVIALPAKILLETLKKFPEQPITFDISMDTKGVDIITDKGKFSVIGLDGDEFPEIPKVDVDKASHLQLPASLVLSGINKTLFATADDELRPVMNGILIEMSPESLTFVASDSHKLVRYQRSDATTEFSSSFILPKKPASFLKNVLVKEDGDISIDFDDKNAFFQMENHQLVCRLVEGNYPSYNAVIPQDNPNKIIINRQEVVNSLGRVSLFSNQASNLVKLSINGDELMVSAQDIDFSISAYEKLSCQYDGQPIEIGFKSAFLAELLDNISTDDVVMELADPARAGIFLPVDNDGPEDELMLLMPMMINA